MDGGASPTAPGTAAYTVQLQAGLTGVLRMAPFHFLLGKDALPLWR